MTPEEIAALVRATAAQRGIDPEWAYRVANQESRFNPRAVSPMGAQGVMQLMPGTARDLGVTDPFDARSNIDGGVRYLKQLSDRYGGDQMKASAAYNWGMGNVDRQGMDRMPAETRDYIAKVAKSDNPFLDLNPYENQAKNDNPFADLNPYANEPAQRSPQARAQQEFTPTAQRQSEAVPESLGGRIAASAGSMLTDLGIGAKQLINEQFLRNRNQSIGWKWVYDKLGYDPEKTAQNLRAELAEKRRIDKPLLDSQGGTTGRVLGAVGAAIPTMLIPGASTLGGSALTGAALGGLEPVSADESRLSNVAIGGAGGALGYGAGKLLNNIGRRFATKTAEKNAEIAPAIARAKEAESLGVNLTRGQATRDPKQWAFERNARGLDGAGEPLLNRFTDQNQALISAMNNLSREAPQGSYKTGEAALSSLGKVDAAKNEAVGKAYDFAKNSLGVDAQLNAPRLADTIAQRLDQEMIGDALPSGVRNAINQFAQGAAPLNIKRAEQVVQALNKQYGSDARTNAAIGLVKNAIAEEIDQIGSQAGQQTASAFQAARATAKSRFQWQDSIPAAKALADGKATPDDFIQKFIERGKVSDISNTMRALPLKDRVAVQDQILDNIKSKALSGATDEAGTFSQAGFNRVVNGFGREKLTAILGKQKAEELFKIGRVAESVMRQPPNATVNSSNTGAAMFNMLRNSTSIPLLGPNVTAPIMSGVQRYQVGRALSPLEEIQQGMFSRSMMNPALQEMMRYGLLGGALNAPQFSQ